MSIHVKALAGAVVVAALLAGSAQVQAQSGPGQAGTRQSAGNLTGRSSGGQTAGAGASMSQVQGYGLNSRFTGSGFNRFMTGSTAMGQTTAGLGAATSGAFGSGGAGMGGQTRFGGSQSFGMMGMLGGMGRGMFGMNNRMMMGGMGGMGAQGNQTGTVRTRMRLGFETPGSPAGSVAPRVSQVVQRVLDRPDVGGGQVSIAMEGNTAVLTGTVASKHARDVVERLALLEPGIAAVRNELTVRPDEPTRATAPTPSAADQRP